MSTAHSPDWCEMRTYLLLFFSCLFFTPPLSCIIVLPFHQHHLNYFDTSVFLFRLVCCLRWRRSCVDCLCCACVDMFRVSSSLHCLLRLSVICLYQAVFAYWLLLSSVWGDGVDRYIVQLLLLLPEHCLLFCWFVVVSSTCILIPTNESSLLNLSTMNEWLHLAFSLLFFSHIQLKLLIFMLASFVVCQGVVAVVCLLLTTSSLVLVDLYTAFDAWYRLAIVVCLLVKGNEQVWLEFFLIISSFLLRVYCMLLLAM